MRDWIEVNEKKTKKIKEPDNKIDKLKGNMINYRERNSWKKNGGEGNSWKI